MNLKFAVLPIKLINKLRLSINSQTYVIIGLLLIISILSYLNYLSNGLGLSYNDARSHLDIGRRVVEGLKPGLAQLGSVWLPLPHVLMIPTIWNDFMWHSGLSGALQSMFSFIASGAIIYHYLKRLGVGVLGRLIAVVVFITNLNILYLQSTAMTELLLIVTMTAAAFELLNWWKDDKLLSLIKASFWVMAASLIRYDGWFLFLMATFLIGIHTYKKLGYKAAEARVLFFSTVAALGIGLWLLWNLLIFKDPLYFIFGPYSAYAQQQQLAAAGNLATKGNLLFSAKVYFYALSYNTNIIILLLSLCGTVSFYFDKKVLPGLKLASTALFAPLLFNILALYLGQSVLFIQGLSGNTWFNVRYGIVMMPAIAIFIGYLIHRLGKLKYLVVGLVLMIGFFAFANQDAVTIDDARVGSSQKNVSEVSGWLRDHAKSDGFILISAASHDAIIFSSGYPMKKFIHEGTGKYWLTATAVPDRWARWIIMRTHDKNDETFRLLENNKALSKYRLVGHYPFADIYELMPEYVNFLNTKPTLGPQK